MISFNLTNNSVRVRHSYLFAFTPPHAPQLSEVKLFAQDPTMFQNCVSNPGMSNSKTVMFPSGLLPPWYCLSKS